MSEGNEFQAERTVSVNLTDEGSVGEQGQEWHDRRSWRPLWDMLRTLGFILTRCDIAEEWHTLTCSLEE